MLRFLLSFITWVGFCSICLAQNPYVTVTGTLQGPNGLPASNQIISLSPTQAFFVAGLGSSSCSSYIIEINGTALSCDDTVNFNSTTPVAPTNGINVTFAKSTAGSIDSVSAAVVGDGNVNHCLLGNGTFGSCGNGNFQGSPSWLEDSDGSPFSHNAAAGGSFGVGVSNLVTCFMFRLSAPFSFNTVGFFINSGTAGSIGIGIYSAAGSRLIHWDSISGLGPGFGLDTTATPTGGAQTLQPDNYYWCWAFSTSSFGNPTTNGSLATEGSNSNTMPYNRSVVRAGTAANPMAAGVLPATLGALTAGVQSALPLWTVEP